MQHKNADYFKALETFIDNYTEKIGSSPTNREIARATGLSPATVSRYLSYMRQHGMLDYEGHRNIQTDRQRKMKRQTTNVPILGRIACGIPKFAEENIEEYVRLPISLFGQGDFFILRADGDSMIDAGINDGDLVLIRRQSTADEGQIVVALVDDEATLKRYYFDRENRRIRLHPENDAMDDYYVDNCIIQGVAVKVFKDLA